MHGRPPSGDAGPPERDGAYNVRSVPVRVYLPDGPVIQDLVPPILEDGALNLLKNTIANLRAGAPHTLAHFLSTHVPLLFPPRPPAPPPSRSNPHPQAPSVPELAYPLIQGVVTPLEAEMAWLGACLAGADGWLNICVGISRKS